MKSADTKTTAAAQPAHAQEQATQPFFQKDGQGSFFSGEAASAEPFFSPKTVQPKLTIGKPGDKYEQEADAMAEKVVSELSESKPATPDSSPAAKTSTAAPPVQAQAAASPEGELQEKADEEEGLEMEPGIQRKAIFESNEEAPEANVQTKLADTPNLQAMEEEPEVQAKTDAPAPAAPDLSSRLNSTKGSGQPLPEDTRSSMESGFGADFGGVRVHTDDESAQMNQDLGAHAFTHGSDIYFNEGKYDTGSTEGQKLLAHELTHTVQQGGSPNTVQKKEKETDTIAPAIAPIPQSEAPASIQKTEGDAAATVAPTTPINITHRFEPDQAWAAYLDNQRGNVQVPVTMDGNYQGHISVRKDTRRATANRPGRYILNENRIQYLDISGMQFLTNAGITPILVLNAFGDEGQTTGFLSIRRGDTAVGNILGLVRSFDEKMEQMRFLGLTPFQVPQTGIENKFENGRLVFQVNQLTTVIDGYLRAGGGFGIMGDAFTFNLTANVDIAGLASGEFTLGREESGALNGRATIQANIANVDASIVVEYIDGAVTIQGTGQMQSEKFTGSITLLVTDENRSRAMMHAALGVQALEQEAASPEQAPAAKTPRNQVLVGWGEVTARITPWLEGTAKIGIDAHGHVTVVGEIVVPGEVELMEMRGKKTDLFNVELRAGYGIPVIGQVFLFANIGMFINAGFGPLVLRDIRFEGTYSTDPSILQQFSITGSLAVNAFAVLGLEAEAGVGLTLLGHDVKAGVNVTAAAGIRAYALVTPTFEYAEHQAAGGKVGEAHLRGHFEAAAQLFLQLTGALFVELDCPWWSPLSDGREEMPLGEVQYPIGDSMGIGGDIDWLVGSPDVPEIEFSPVEFDPNQFTADVMADPPPGRQGEAEAAPEGEWQDGATPGNLDGQPQVQEGGEGTPHGPQHEENLRNLPDEQRYMRGLSEISDIAEARERQTTRVVEAKINRIKSKYNLDEARIREENDDNVQIFVRHAQQDNGHHLVQVPVMSEAERIRLLHAAMEDLTTRMNQQAGEAGQLSQADARSVADAWHGAHPVIESVRVVDGRDSWDFQVDIGDRNQVVPGKGKAEAESEIKIEKPVVMFGMGHHLTVEWKNDTLASKLASREGELIAKVEGEKRKHEEIAANTSTEEVKVKHSAIASDLQTEIIEWYSIKSNEIRTSGTEGIKEKMLRLADDLASKILILANAHKLKDFIYEAFNVTRYLDAIRVQIVEQLEKHINNDDAIGDGHANSATAAEIYLDWKRESGETHILKTNTAQNVILSSISSLDEIEQRAGTEIGIKQEVWYIRGKETAQDCQRAMSQPRAFLLERGVMSDFVKDIIDRRAKGETIGFEPQVSEQARRFHLI